MAEGSPETFLERRKANRSERTEDVPRYRALRVYAAILKGIGAVSLLIGVGLLAGMLLSRSESTRHLDVGVPFVLTGIGFLVFGELASVAINAAADIRRTRVAVETRPPSPRP